MSALAHPIGGVRERGAAIVLALSVVALAALAASAMMVSQGVWIRQIELATGRTQGQFIIQAGLDWARAVLDHDRHVSSVDHLGESWAVRLSPIPVDNGSIAGYLEDQQARFNLNNLLKDGAIDRAQLAVFRRLLSILGLQPVKADMLADWMEVDGRPLVDASELARLSCFDEGTRARLRPFVTVLPRSTAVNVNTAAPEVLAAVVEGLNLDDARALVAQRDRAYFRSTSEFLDQLPRNLTRPAGGISVSSGYFMATIYANFGGAHARGLALLARDELGGWPAIVWRKYL
jgi:general secretion pathway protein K